MKSFMRAQTRGQAAMEFLMTYGWAIMAAIIALGVLAYFGVFKQSAYSPEQAYVTPPFYAEGAAAQNAPGTDGQLQLELANHGGEDYTITGIDATGCGALGGTFTINPSTSQVFTIPCNPLSAIASAQEGQSVTGTFAVTYLRSGSLLAQTVMGQFVAKVRRGIAPVLSVLFGGATPANGSTQGSPNIPVALTTTSSGSLERYAFVDLDRSLVGWWRFDDVNDVGDLIIDLSTYSTANLSIYNVVTNGKFGNAFNFTPATSGGSGRVTLGVADPSAANYRPGLDISKAITISAWVYVYADTPPQQNSIINTGFGNVNTLYNIDLDTTTSPTTLIFKRADAGANLVTATALLPAFAEEEWHQVAVTVDDSVTRNVILYFDGVQVGTDSYVGTPTFAPSLLIGMAGDHFGSLSFNGLLDDFLMFNRSLSASEIASLYDSQANPYSYTFIGQSSGTHVFQGHVVDAGGNKSSTAWRTVTIV